MNNTGSEYLDKFLAYGSYINCIYGKAATGKTNMCHLAAVHYAKSKKVIFIDTENSFSVDRLYQVQPKPELENIILLKAKNLDEQCKAIERCLALKNKIGLVIVDSLSMHYRKALQQRENPNPVMSKQLSILSEIAREDIPIIITCQVYTSPDGTLNPVGNNMVKNWSKSIIRLHNENGRFMVFEKHPEKPSFQIPFIICNDGIKGI